VARLTRERLAGQRWFAAKARDIDRIERIDDVSAGAGTLAVVDVHLAGASAERYAMPEGAPLWGPLLARLAAGPERGFRLSPTEAELDWDSLRDGAELLLDRDQSNSSYVLDERIVVKCYRRLRPGVHPEVELVRFLGERFAPVPAALGSLHHVDRSGEEWALALVQELVPDAEDGWAWCGTLVEEAVAEGAVDAGWAGEVGTLTAELHAALAALGARRGSAVELRARRRSAEEALSALGPLLDPTVADGLRRQLALFDAAAHPPTVGRVHGDYHVGQLLRSSRGYHVIDFEGEPTRPLEERRAPDSPLRDVASMLRSIDHVPLWVLRDRPEARGRGEAWANACRAAFLEAYAETTLVLANTSGLPLDHALLRAFEAEKAAYEFAYAQAFLPEWLPVASAGAELLLSRQVGE
jgi:maltokinase